MRRTKHLLEQLLALARHEAALRPRRMADRGLDHVAKDVVADLLPEALNRGIDLGFAADRTYRGARRAGHAGDDDPQPARQCPALHAARRTHRHRVYRDGDAAVLQIEDTGPGIPPDDMDRIFEPFFRGQPPEAREPALACRS